MLMIFVILGQIRDKFVKPYKDIWNVAIKEPWVPEVRSLHRTTVCKSVLAVHRKNGQYVPSKKDVSNAHWLV